MTPPSLPIRVAWLRCENLPEPDPDEAPALGALRAAGIGAEPVNWDNPEGAAALEPFHAAIFRATWNYYLAPERFLHFVDQAASRVRLINPAPIVRWNLHKRYLLELEARGIPIIPTRLIGAGEPPILGPVPPEGIVIKPAISAGSWQTRHFGVHHTHAAQQFLGECTQTRPTLIQPFVPSVQNGGEVACVFLGGALTHAVIKRPRFAQDSESVERLRTIPTELATFAHRALEAVGAPLTYARVDIVPSPSGSYWLSELELIEPSLFLSLAPEHLTTFAATIEGAVGGERRCWR